MWFVFAPCVVSKRIGSCPRNASAQFVLERLSCLGMPLLTLVIKPLPFLKNTVLSVIRQIFDIGENPVLTELKMAPVTYHLVQNSLVEEV